MKKILMFFCVCVMCSMMYAQNDMSEKVAYGQDFIQGLEAYKVGNWEDTLFFLKRTNDFQNMSSDVVWYFVILSEINIADYSAALRDGTTFLSSFPESVYYDEILYQTWYACYNLGMYEESIEGLTMYIRDYPKSKNIDSALFYTAESLYKVYEFEQARSLFERIVAEFPSSKNYKDAMYRLELLDQRDREEKLLYLLRVTGEETIATKEEYERKLKELQEGDIGLLQKQIIELEEINREIEIERQQLITQVESLKKALDKQVDLLSETPMQVVEPKDYSVITTTMISELSKKADQLEKILEKVKVD